MIMKYILRQVVRTVYVASSRFPMTELDLCLVKYVCDLLVCLEGK